MHHCIELPGPVKRAFVRLEPCAVKVACTVLRGGNDGNVVLLPDIVSAQRSTILSRVEQARGNNKEIFFSKDSVRSAIE